MTDHIKILRILYIDKVVDVSVAMQRQIPERECEDLGRRWLSLSQHDDRSKQHDSEGEDQRDDQRDQHEHEDQSRQKIVSEQI